MDLYEMADRVTDRVTFLKFVDALAMDAQAADKEPMKTSDNKINLSPDGWENGTIATFLSAMAAWTADNSRTNGPARLPEEPSWRSFAKILLAGKMYE